MRLAVNIICILFLLSMTGAVYGQGYKIGVGDKLEVTFWQDPALNMTVRVAEDGTVLLPVGGSIQAAGLSLEELSSKIIDSISLFYRNITSAAVSVVEYGSQRVYVMGQVINPGKYMFEKIPDLWEIISEAGGATEQANLNNVIIIREEEGENRSITVDLASVLRDREFESLPEIRPGDTIHIPAVIGTVAGSGINAIQSSQKVLFIYGQVGAPGVYTFNKQLNLLEALVTAGGPTEDAALNMVKVIRKTGAYSSVTEIDVKRYSKESVPQFFMVQEGDAIYVPRRRVFTESVVWEFGRLAITIALTAFIYDIVRERN